jgi:outer membrane lipoprotein-sorting protein
MIKRHALLFLAIFAGLGMPVANAETADEIIAASDRVRNPRQPFRLSNTLIEYRSGKPAQRMVLVVYAKEDQSAGQFRNLVRFVEPPRDSGKMVLKNGNIMWFYDPSSKVSIRLSPQQRLIGQASNGDVITVNLAKDYKGSLIAEETIQDADRKERACWHLDMSATSDGATYNRIEYWVEKQTYYPIKGKYYSDSGRLLKIAYYRKFEEQLGGVRPTEAIIIDAVDSALVTKMTFSDYRPQDIPEAWFQREYLPRLGVE